MNKHIIAGVTIAFVVSFTVLFSMHFISQDSRIIQNMENHPFFCLNWILKNHQYF